MKYLIKPLVFLCSILLLSSCGKAGADSGTAKVTPVNLVVTSVVSTDGSGNVAFTATAQNAVSYGFEFGNGDVKTVPSGATSYQYTLAGSNTYTVTVTASGSTGITLKKSIEVTVTVTQQVPTLFWSDEFNVDGAPDPTKWTHELGAGGWGNAELQYYTSRRENSIVEGGVLKVKAIKENYSGSNYTSARMVTKDKFAFKYGTVEVRAKVPTGVGTWPAIWMLGSNISNVSWPACGELDIMEHLGRDLNKIYGTLHYPGRSGGTADGSTKMIANATTEFHLYKVEWTAAAIKIYVDNELYHTTVNSASIPFNHDFFFIINMAMGGNFGGAMDPAVTSATMEVDYIRVYK